MIRFVIVRTWLTISNLLLSCVSDYCFMFYTVLLSLSSSLSTIIFHHLQWWHLGSSSCLSQLQLQLLHKTSIQSFSHSTRSNYKPYAVNVQRSATLPANNSSTIKQWVLPVNNHVDPQAYPVFDAGLQLSVGNRLSSLIKHHHLIVIVIVIFPPKYHFVCFFSWIIDLRRFDSIEYITSER